MKMLLLKLYMICYYQHIILEQKTDASSVLYMHKSICDEVIN